MKGYKGFKKGLVCRGKQYAENTIFEEENAEICKSGMHFCENPFDVLNYYGFVNDEAELNEFAEVEALDECTADDKGEKYTTKKMKIGAKLSIAGLVKAFVDFTFKKEDGYTLVNFRARKVDGKIIKEDTFYTLKNGKFVEVKE